MQDSSKMKVLLVFGTRPEAIKMAPLVKEFQKYPEKFDTKVCVTGQHREMLDQVLRLFEIIPDYDLNIMKSGQDLFDVTSGVLLGMRDVLNNLKPNIVLVHGDTSTSTAASLAAFYMKIPVGHIEAGLRTNDIYSPWPEEMNRQITGRLASFHFAPTESSKENLIKEGINEASIFVTGNSVIDAMFWVIGKMKESPSLVNQILEKLPFNLDLIERWISGERKLILITGHRRENFGKGFSNICEAIKMLSKSFPKLDFVYPMHLNPNVRAAIFNVFDISDRDWKNKISIEDGSNTHFVEPLDYLPFIFMMNLSHLILTDSGGIQEEAPGLGKPVLVMRDNTERPEAIKAGTIKLVGTNKEKIINEVSLLINNIEEYRLMKNSKNPYGDGFTSKIIVDHFLNDIIC
jgi:UDP-N-acetylglucosamine 2-epimerase (non-hydrolysing)